MSSSLPHRRWLAVALLLVGACSSSADPSALLTATESAPSTTEPRRSTTTTSRITTTTRRATTTSTTTSTITTTTFPPTAAAPTTTQTPPAANGTTVTRVVDGDTFDVRMGGGTETVRIIGMNAPEDGECLAADAEAWLRNRIDGRTVVLVSDQTDRDQYGRLLRYVELDGRDVGVEIVRAGLAIARRYPPDTTRANALETAQREAEAAKVGMWRANACGTQSSAEVVISEIRFDADGNDNDNKNDEWVRIKNVGGASVDLTGWVLKDESASHRYHYPDGFTLESAASVTVRTGCGTDTSSDLYWCNSRSAVWNNSGDTAFLLDPAGNVVDSRKG